MMVLPSRLGVNIMSFGALHYFSAEDFNPAQLLTYMFMHDTRSFLHILFNMWMLFMFGGMLERYLGSGRFLFYYISCGIGAALIQELVWAMTWEGSMAKAIAMMNHVDLGSAREIMNQALNSSQGRAVMATNLNMFQTIGASGAIYGVLLAFGMLFPNLEMYLMFIPVPIKAKWMVLGMGVFELLIGLSNTATGSDGVAHFAHLGGMIFGFLILLYWRKKGLFNGGNYYG